MADVHCSVCGHVIADIVGPYFSNGWILRPDCQRLAIGCNECGSTTGVVVGAVRCGEHRAIGTRSVQLDSD